MARKVINQHNGGKIQTEKLVMEVEEKLGINELGPYRKRLILLTLKKAYQRLKAWSNGAMTL